MSKRHFFLFVTVRSTLSILQVCGKELFNKWACQTHVQTVHMKQQNVKCPMFPKCDMAFYSYSAKNKHVAKEHPELVKEPEKLEPKVCTICGLQVRIFEVTTNRIVGDYIGPLGGETLSSSPMTALNDQYLLFNFPLAYQREGSKGARQALSRRETR